MTDTLTIKTNNQPRDVLHWWDLTPAEQSDLDYVDSDTKQGDFQGFRYKGQVYDLGDFERWDNPGSVTLQGWDGFQADSYFSGIAVRWVEDYERVVVALVLS